jgi:hypothetical protein
MSLESAFQKEVIDELRHRLPGCVVLKNDAQFQPGIPDLVVFYGNRYAFLEVKRGAKEKRQAGQEFFTSLFAKWSYGAMIYPENRELILDEIQHVLGARRPSLRA